MKRLLFGLGVVGLFALHGTAQTSFPLTGGGVPVGGEYFFDEDPGLGNGSPLPFDSGETSQLVGFSPDLSELGAGNHQLYVRLQNSRGEWTMARQHGFMLVPEAVRQSSEIATVSYSFDGEEQLRELTVPDSSGEVSGASWSLDTSGLEAGSHRALIHLEDSRGIRGFPQVVPFYLLEQPGATSLVWSIRAGDSVIDQGAVDWEEKEKGVATATWLIDPILAASDDALDLRIGIENEGSLGAESVALSFSVESPLFLGGIELSIEGAELVLRFATPLVRSAVLEQSSDLQEWGELVTLDPGLESARIPASETYQFFRVRQIFE